MYKPPLEPFGMLIVSSIALDDKDHIWIGSEESGLHQFDNTIWQKYPKPFCFFKNMVTALVLDSKGCLWVGTWFGLRKFENPTESNHEIDVEIEVDFNFSIPVPMTMDEQEQEAYFAHNYPDKELKWIDSDWSDDYKDVVNFYGWDRDNRDVNLINCLASDSFGNLWVGSGMGNGRGLSKFDGKTWTNYNTFNSGIPTNSVRVLATDHLGGVWIGSTVGLTFFNGANWITYNTLNSGLLNDRVTAIAIEAQGTIWVGTDAGLSEFKRTL
jgi:Two component regulator propeller